MMRVVALLVCFVASTIVAIAVPAVAPPVAAARAVLIRLIGHRALGVNLGVLAAADGKDTYEYEASHGKLTVKGSSGVAICRGFYDYLKDHHLGMVTWAGNSLRLPTRWPDAMPKRIKTAFQDRYYLNVVTYGYTMPYWTWARWEKELDWMALHGVNMPLALVGTEAIATRVWKKIGLTSSEIDEFYTGPAHLPWQRMGNITKHDGPLSASWHADQVALQHKILRRMRELGIKPIAPGFAGFVPKGLRRLRPGVNLHLLSWGGFAPDKSALLLDHTEPMFQKLGKMFVQEWEHEFGRSSYWLVDSFNEMEIPFSGKEKLDYLANYGATVYRSIRSGDPAGVWVMQGWTLGNHSQWTPPMVRALLSKVPDNGLLMLDECCDYNANYWHTVQNWSLFEGYHNKQWVYCTIPNMGGKTGYTGILDFYATDVFKTLKDPSKGRMEGIGTAPEGIDNNEVIYELITDDAWRTTAPNLKTWLEEYSINRYGAFPSAIDQSWELLLHSVYGTFTDHPHFGWQHMNSGPGTMNQDAAFTDAVRKLLSASDQLKTSDLYRADAIEQSAMVLGSKAATWFGVAQKAHDFGDPDLRDKASARALQLLLDADRLLESHPNHRLQRWLDFARAHGSIEAERNRYESNARRLITTWGTPEINDYSCRLWSGLIRDFYAPRMALYFQGLRSGKSFVKDPWEEKWVQSSGVSKIEPFQDPIAAARRLVVEACEEAIPTVSPKESNIIGYWSPSEVGETWRLVRWELSPESVQRIEGVHFLYTGGRCRLDMKEVALLVDGAVVCSDEHQGMAGTPSQAELFHFRLSPAQRKGSRFSLQAMVRSDGGSDSRGMLLILPP